MEEPEAGVEAEAEVESDAPRAKKKDRERGDRAERGYAGGALRELRRARRALDQAPEPGTVPAEAAASLQIANTLALLDLAAAVRGRSTDEPAVVEE